ncbi:hypothetical protein ABDK56_09285 [Sphingomonas sp. ASV193]|uniref:hypothetical protein n=1 Tax=Sphingomonas sp. ASV193 TaxID=3144405 RepID=UPI0032E90430
MAGNHQPHLHRHRHQRHKPEKPISSGGHNRLTSGSGLTFPVISRHTAAMKQNAAKPPSTRLVAIASHGATTSASSAPAPTALASAASPVRIHAA